MLKLHIPLLGLLLSAPLAVSLSASPYLVKDLNHGPANPGSAVLYDTASLGSVLYFPGSDPGHGSELWRTDGTPDGTYRVTDVCAGSCGSTPALIRAVGAKIYFQADDGVSGRELWVTDGAPGHEHRVRDLCPGPCGSDPSQGTAVGDQVVFTARLGQRSQLWRTDGTRAGTVRLALLCVQPNECVAFPPTASIGGRAFFGLLSGVKFDLWETDGTAAGTFPVKNLVSGLGLVSTGPVAGPGFVYFWTADSLWRTDGTAAGTFKVKALADLAPAATLDPFAYRAVVSGGLLYAVLGSGVVVRSDGTAAGTFVVHQFATEVTALAAVAEGIVLAVRNPGPPSSTLWVSGGTAESTVQIADLSASGLIDVLISAGDRAFFRALPSSSAIGELWTTDGTSAGTVRLKSGVTATASQDTLSTAGGQVFFLQDTALFFSSPVLWAADGTGAHPVHDFGAGPGSSGPLDQTAFAGKLLFSAWTSPNAVPLFLSDGTAAGTQVLSSAADFGTDFTLFAGKVYFGAGVTISPAPGDPIRHDGFWRTDGTPAGTVKVGNFLFENPKVLGSQLLFSGATLTSGPSNLEPYRTDGTDRGTRLVADLDPYEITGALGHTCLDDGSFPGPGVLVGNRLLFAADDGVHGRELWSTDGTTRNTRLVADINPKRSPEPPASCLDSGDTRTDSGLPSNPDGFARLGAGNVALFAADDGTTGRELWSTDGTPKGTRRIADLFPGAMGSNPHDLTRLGNLIYFFASPTGSGDALYRTDGTAKGTVLVSNLQLNGTPTWAKSLTASGGKLFFAAYNELVGNELWTSTGQVGNPNATRIVADLNGGPASSSPQFLTDVGGVLLFAADDGLHGLELWRTDGTGAGTISLGDINPGPSSSSPGPFTIVGGRVYFGADDGVHGRELWAILVNDIVNP